MSADFDALRRTPEFAALLDHERIVVALLPQMARIRGAHNGDEPCEWCELAAEQAAEAIAALSPSDRLAIAGVTEERLAPLLHRAMPHDAHYTDTEGHCTVTAVRVLAGLSATEVQHER